MPDRVSLPSKGSLERGWEKKGETCYLEKNTRYRGKSSVREEKVLRMNTRTAKKKVGNAWEKKKKNSYQPAGGGCFLQQQVREKAKKSIRGALRDGKRWKHLVKKDCLVGQKRTGKGRSEGSEKLLEENKKNALLEQKTVGQRKKVEGGEKRKALRSKKRTKARYWMNIGRNFFSGSSRGGSKGGDG